MQEPTFIREVADHVGGDERRAAVITGIVLAEMRARVDDQLAATIGGRLPRDLRAVWTGAGALADDEPSYRLELLGDVMQRAALPDSVEAERAVIAVFSALRRLLGTATSRTVRALSRALPRDLEVLWIAADAGRERARASQLTETRR